MAVNAELVEILDNIADLLDLLGERFKPDAYRRAARSIESLGEDLRAVAARGELRTIPGVGEAIATKIQEFLSTGRIDYYEKLRTRVPPGVRELLSLPGVGPKSARRFWVELGVEGPRELAAAIDAGKLTGFSGFAAKKIDALRQGLAALGAEEGPPGRRVPLLEAWELAERLLGRLRTVPGADQVVAAGSLRRRRETIGDLDILATTTDAEGFFRAFAADPEVQSVRLRGPTKMTVVVAPGMQVDVRAVEPASFGAALQYFTGSKDHNIRLRSIARDRGLKVNEYGVFRGATRIAGATEEEVYASLHLPMIPPEIRENRGEIEAAEGDRVPVLIDPERLTVEPHLDLRALQDGGSLSAWRDKAAAIGLTTLGVVAPARTLPGAHDALREAWQKLPSRKGVVALRFGVEREEDSGAPPESPAEFWVLRVTAGASAPPARAPRSARSYVAPRFATGLATEAGEETAAPTLEGWLRWSLDTGAALEVTPSPGTEGLGSGAVRKAVEADTRLVVTSRAQRPEELVRLRLAAGVARRGWATPTAVLDAGDDVGSARAVVRPRRLDRRERP